MRLYYKINICYFMQYYAVVNEKMKRFNYFPSKCFLPASFTIANEHEDRSFLSFLSENVRI